jgi:AraC-like DNA-binding protein
MHNNILLILPIKKEQAALLNKLQPAFTIYATDTLVEIEQLIKEKNIELVICTAEHYANTRQAVQLPETENDFINRLHSCIAANIQNKVLSVDFLASTMNMSRPTLYRKIKTITNQTPNELIALARLKQAAVLLASANYKVFEVAEMTGFNSPSSFGKAFLKQFKVTPVAYQQNYKNAGVHLNEQLSM